MRAVVRSGLRTSYKRIDWLAVAEEDADGKRGDLVTGVRKIFDDLLERPIPREHHLCHPDVSLQPQLFEVWLTAHERVGQRTVS